MSRCLLILIILFSTQSILAEEDPRPMVNGYHNFKEIQKIIHNKHSELSDLESEKLFQLVKSLRSSLHEFKDYPNQSRLPGFKDNLELLNQSLLEIEKNLKSPSSNDDWAIWRVKTISTNCQTCHSNFSVEISFQDSDIPAGFDNFEKAEFLLSSRQYQQAEKYYWEFIKAGDYQKNGFNYALNRWIDLIVRILQTPDLGIEKLKLFLKSKPEISRYELEDLKSWQDSLVAWQESGGEISDDFQVNKKLISNLLNSNEPAYEKINLIKTLRAAAGFHKIYEHSQSGLEHQPEILYYLGLIYARTPMFFVYELPEIYLKLCINNFPGTPEAQKSFQLLKELVTNGFTGSGGTHLDLDTKKELDRLMQKAYSKF